MIAALAVKPLPRLNAQYGPMRTVLHATKRTDVAPEQRDAFTLNLLGGKELRESYIRAADGSADLTIRFVEYIDPVTHKILYAIDYWSVAGYWATDHPIRAVAEKAYEEAVRVEFAHPTLPLSPERFKGGLAHFYDVTDVF
ncbi:hypothetical protein ACGFYQ_33775 [Streptomyces sp. NPDC048258]|uniref:hypothetical protein n=1 Tax=Streptomyces sp. NPDC048258 TaxID=3365527 RepID=UPI00370F7E64